nr:MAG TPA: hypothetical protein [Caudoviricetes sp.]
MHIGKTSSYHVFSPFIQKSRVSTVDTLRRLFIHDLLHLFRHGLLHGLLCSFARLPDSGRNKRGLLLNAGAALNASSNQSVWLPLRVGLGFYRVVAVKADFSVPAVIFVRHLRNAKAFPQALFLGFGNSRYQRAAFFCRIGQKEIRLFFGRFLNGHGINGSHDCVTNNFCACIDRLFADGIRVFVQAFQFLQIAVYSGSVDLSHSRTPPSAIHSARCCGLLHIAAEAFPMQYARKHQTTFPARRTTGQTPSR